MAKNVSKSKQPWRKAVRHEMKKAAEEEARKKANSNHPSFKYRWEHVQAVVACAIKLAELTGADKDVVEAAAWMHDIRKDAGERHPQEGAKFARKLLPKTNFPKKKIAAVATAIEDHMGLWRDKPLKNLESQVLWDADKLTKIGITSAIHWIGGGLARDKKAYTTKSLLAGLESAEWRTKTVASMHTAPAKKAAKKRLNALDAMIKQLALEWSTQDLL